MVVQQPHPAGQLRGDVDETFPGGDELLGEQRTRPGGTLDRMRWGVSRTEALILGREPSLL